jgi:hypothetical protein
MKATLFEQSTDLLWQTYQCVLRNKTILSPNLVWRDIQPLTRELRCYGTFCLVQNIINFTICSYRGLNLRYAYFSLSFTKHGLSPVVNKTKFHQLIYLPE